MTLGITTYFFYLAISTAFTAWVGRTIYKNGRVFLIDAFHGNESLADSVNHLLVCGFYLISFGYISLVLNLGYTVADPQEAIEALSIKIGLVLLALGLMHFFNLFLFTHLRNRKSATHHHVPPVDPDAFTSVQQEA
ncbi:MAG TPA: hypothetical protein VHH35_17660 [Pyrinomonadaceae bacterium]|nr:hypothetical protein [Pyrinomonadaceae bacterium]